MSGRHEPSPRKFGARWLAGGIALLVAVFAAAAGLILASPAGAATTDDAQISLTGLVDDDNPTGGSQLGIHPGDSIKFSASAAPTAKVKSLVKSLGLNGLLDSLLGTVDFQVKADFSKLPGGSANTVLTGKTSKSFHFPNAGTYHFTWTAQKISVNLLGKTVVPIELDGNQVKQAGLELNAQSEYVGTIVVAKNPPKGGISIQLPSVKAHPKVGGIQLPEVNVPGASLPTVKVPDVPNLNPGKNKPGGGKSTGASSTAPDPGLTYVPPGVSVPELVVPQGTGGGGGGGGAYNGVLPGGNAQIGNLALPDLSGNGADADPAAKGTQSQGKPKGTVDLASQTAKPSSQLPVVLAIIAIIALALVAGTYARLFLLRKN